LAAKDQRIVNPFAKKGFKVTLMDRNDPKAPFDVNPPLASARTLT
jgi:hypothetical protein